MVDTSENIKETIKELEELFGTIEEKEEVKKKDFSYLED